MQIMIDQRACPVQESQTVLGAAAAAGIYIPALCNHPDLPPFADLPRAPRVFRGDVCYLQQSAPTGSPPSSIVGPPTDGCGLCVVAVEGAPEPVRACHTPVAPGMIVRTSTPSLVEVRRLHLMRILARHPHACLTCAQREGCSLENCSSNVPREERCCSKFHNCELRKVADYVGIRDDTPRFRHPGLQVLRDEPLFVRDYNLCIDCARCVRVCNQVRGVGALGLVDHDGRRVVGSIAPTLLASGCKFCGACVEVCPTGCLLDQAVPSGPRERWLVPCRQTCPAGVDVPGYIRRIAAGDHVGAAALLWETLPLPNTLGHICFHTCEPQCRRGQIDEPLAICPLKRFALAAADGADLAARLRPPPSGQRVAVIGSGPAGLAAAYFLRAKGHAITVFEAAEFPGGVPAQAVPDYRLPPDVLARDLEVIRRFGVEIRTRQQLDRQAITALLGEGFDAVLVAVGLPEPKRIAVPGHDLAGVHWGLEFLAAVKRGQPPVLGAEVAVIGGGNVAIDAARTALRLSHGRVRLFCLESRDEMPAHPEEVAAAQAEGIEVHTGWGPAAIRGADGHASSIELRRCLRVFDEHRHFAPEFAEHERLVSAADAVILAIGQAPPRDLPATRPGLFLAGDIAGGTPSVVHAVASGRAAAEQIDLFLGGDGRIAVQLAEHAVPPACLGRDDAFAPRPRVPVRCAAAGERGSDFRPVEQTYTPAEAAAEARRCLQCDLRLAISAPPRPPEPWAEFCLANVEKVPPVEGVYILADAQRKPAAIKGAGDVRAALLEKLAVDPADCWFAWEEDRLYTKRESELIQRHLQQYGELPGGGDDLF